MMIEPPVLAEAMGWCAAGFMLASAGSPEVRTMRLFAVGANLAFLGYGLLASLPPVVCLHLLMLPVNLGHWLMAREPPSLRRP